MNTTKFWRNEQGQLHRTDGPAIEYAHGGKAWYLNGTLYRIIYAKGSQEWFNEQGQRDRIERPAYENDRRKEWYQNGRLHRIDGPAIEYADGRKEYWFQGRKLTVKTVMIKKLILKVLAYWHS